MDDDGFDPRVYGLLTLALEAYDTGTGHLDTPALLTLLGGEPGEVMPVTELLDLLNSSLALGVSMLLVIAQQTEGRMTASEVLSALVTPTND